MLMLIFLLCSELLLTAFDLMGVSFCTVELFMYLVVIVKKNIFYYWQLFFLLLLLLFYICLEMIKKIILVVQSEDKF